MDILVNTSHVNLVRREFSLVGVALVLALEKVLAVLVQLKLGDDNLRRVDTDGNGGRSVVLISGDSLNVNHVLLSVHLCDLSLPKLAESTDDLNLVILADRHGADVVLVTELLRERSAHDLSSHARGSGEVSLAVLPAGAADVGVELCRSGRERGEQMSESVVVG